MRVLVRADASRGIGMGHLVRSYALAQALQDVGVYVALAARELPDSFASMLAAQRFQLEILADNEPNSLSQMLQRMRPDWVLLDGYDLTQSHQDVAREASARIAVIDDNAEQPTASADVVINHNPFARPSLYQGASGRLLLGLRYALLRREFALTRRTGTLSDSLLILMGGGDSGNLSAAIASATDPNADVTLAVGPAAVVPAGVPPHVKVLRGPDLISEVMVQAGLAVAGAGGACWELASLGVPVLAVTVAENQRHIPAEIERLGFGRHLGWAHKITRESAALAIGRLLQDRLERERMSKAGSAAVDALGARRVASILAGYRLIVRRARESDARTLWEWANEPEVRAQAFSKDPIPWDSHLAWFNKRVYSDVSIIYIAETIEGDPVGMLRFDVEDGEGTVSLIVAPEHRGKGYAGELCRLAIRRFFGETAHVRLKAYARTENEPSIRTWIGLGFEKVAELDLHGEHVAHFRYLREWLPQWS